MRSARVLFFVAAAALLIGVGLMLLQPGAPDAECVPEGTPSSGFADEESGCPISQESWAEISDWNSSPKLFRIAGLIVIVGGVGAGVAGGVIAARGRRTSRG